MTETDNAELAERIAAFGKVVLFDDDERSHHLSDKDRDRIVAALRCPAPRVSEEQVALIIWGLEVDQSCSDCACPREPDCACWLATIESARTVISLFAGEALGIPTGELQRIAGILTCERMLFSRPAEIEAKIDGRIKALESEIERRAAIAKATDEGK